MLPVYTPQNRLLLYKLLEVIRKTILLIHSAPTSLDSTKAIYKSHTLCIRLCFKLAVNRDHISTKIIEVRRFKDGKQNEEEEEVEEEGDRYKKHSHDHHPTSCRDKSACIP